MALVRPGSEIARERGARHVGRHRHEQAYAALVLRGGYVESGDRGRFRVGAGDVLFHGPFEAHQDDFGGEGADILNLAMPFAVTASSARVADPDAVMRTAERDPLEAAHVLTAGLQPGPEASSDWPDFLAAALIEDSVPQLCVWADAHGLDHATVSRGFRFAYGVSPRRYRLEQRARRAAIAIRGGSEPLAQIATGHGFADQPHMTRALGRLFGRSPRAFREVN
ncbi:helix-turn-helix domain-containing protein [Allosphingosinicella indica]|uniref:Transcriptional regulator, AraC family n=1 Tax=Allosphingosinicella indica TaxID=941907 RepID=A0A1X7G736_9SPHN|nr:AraC family transcriptional regulator [Allosphingosinicella indica]SMF65210.1 transcriptional regulator, AraC family [Allosphingosinicella indica]